VNAIANLLLQGDKIEVHYRGTLEADGTEFDASYHRGSPLSFHVGTGQVIKGWVRPPLQTTPPPLFLACT